MKKINYLNLLLIAVIGFGGISLLGLSGCAGSRMNLAEGRALSIESVPSPGIYFHGVHAHQKGGELAISGEIKRRRTSSVTGGGHLDIAVVGPDGKVVEYVSTIYVPRVLSRRSHRGSYFEVRFSVVPPERSVIRLVLHKLPLPESIYSREFDCGQNAAIPG
ncbi:hypothetical protein MNBD_DELTA01-225 [hydrothermal vent metagenome]|uniref:Uncharacterized protein n=1 Tax=hydrothermal vent metagenome TaxID=652676 RepID=A0A3B0QUQ8_9ZZZZ